MGFIHCQEEVFKCQLCVILQCIYSNTIHSLFIEFLRWIQIAHLFIMNTSAIIVVHVFVCLFCVCVVWGEGGIFDIEFYEYIIIFKSEKYQY